MLKFQFSRAKFNVKLYTSCIYDPYFKHHYFIFCTSIEIKNQQTMKLIAIFTKNNCFTAISCVTALNKALPFQFSEKTFAIVLTHRTHSIRHSWPLGKMKSQNFIHWMVFMINCVLDLLCLWGNLITCKWGGYYITESVPPTQIVSLLVIS
jgi:hypothetical protein